MPWVSRWPACCCCRGAALLAPTACAGAGAALPDFTELVEKVSPSVVNIRTTERRGAAAAGGGGGSGEVDPNIEEFFRRFGIPLPNRRGNPRGDDEQPQQRGVGSGFILSADGFIMTNAHVVEGAEEVIVTLTDKRELKARIVGSDRRTDVAVVKVEASGLPFVKIGDVNRLKVGEWVMAIGSPFGLENTVTAGIVSAKQRDTGDYLPFIQTDVAINPGNSGGPLLNLRGEVVGINSQIYSRSGGFMGISFAIPIDEAMRVSDQLRTVGRVIRGRIGVSIGAVTKEVAESIGLGAPRGALVTGVEKDQPAEKAGVEAGDIILRVDGKAVEKSVDLPRIVGGLKPGSSRPDAGVPARRHARPERDRGRVRGRAPHAPRRGRARQRAAGGSEECARRHRLRPHRSAEARAACEERRAGRHGRGRRRPRRAARGRCDPVGGQRRGQPMRRQFALLRQSPTRTSRDGAGAARRMGQLPGHPAGALSGRVWRRVPANEPLVESAARIFRMAGLAGTPERSSAALQQSVDKLVTCHFKVRGRLRD